MDDSGQQKELAAFQGFPRIDVLWVILISLASLGLYTWWWMYSRSLLVNASLPPHRQINKNFMHMCLGGFFVTLMLAVAAGFQPDNVSLAQTVNILSMALNIMVIVWVLNFRRAAHYLLGEETTPYHFNLLWTLLFQVFYMQYKINRIRDHDQIGIM
jgi:hypothetical protein